MGTTPLSTHLATEPSLQALRVAQPGGSSRLPVSLTSFLGREVELALAGSLLLRPDLRLLTLTGPGGIGKTRLAIEIATCFGAEFSGGVLFVSLAAIQDHSTVMKAIASALGLPELDSVNVTDAVASSLGKSSALLVIDNFEHVLDAAPGLTSLIARCSLLKIVVTSRSLLRVEGEHTIPVPPLALPDPKSTLTYDDWLRVPVIRLFIERAQAVDPSLTLNQNDVVQLVDICGRLDGLPLAIELAATRVRHFTLAEIRDRLNERLPLLIGGSRDHPSRLQTMRNAIAWSHDLLSSSAQVLFRRLAVFRGGFTIESIEAVSAYLEARNLATRSSDTSNRMDEAEAFASIGDRLSMLIDASLLLRDAGSGADTPRYRMLETIREYAGEQLAKSGEEDSALQAHATFFTAYAEQHEFADLMPEHTHAVDKLENERDNLGAALRWLEKSSDPERFIRLVAALGGVWLAQGNYREGRSWFERALEANASSASAYRAKTLVLLGMTEIFQGENLAAEAPLTQGLTACRALGEPYYAGLALIGLAAVAVMRGDGERSTELLQESQLVASAIPDTRLAEIMSGRVSINLAVVARTAGNRDLAARHIADMLRRSGAEDYHLGMMHALGDLGDLARDRGEWNDALTLYKEALSLGRTKPVNRIVIEVIESVAIVAAQTGQPNHSAVLLGAAEGLRERFGLRYQQPESRASVELAIVTTRSALGETFAAAWEIGRNLSEDQVIAEALDVNEVATGPSKSLLTSRETEILKLLATGMTDPEIADALFISVRTVEHHAARIFRKLGVRTRTAATSAAIASGLVAPPEPAALA